MKEIVLGQKLERDELLAGAYIERDGLAEASQAMESGLIKVITGPRRAGKSVFALQMLRGRDFAYINFDDERLAGLGDFDELLKAMAQVYGATRTMFFDEVQNVDNWELFVSRLYRRGYNILLTGSNAHLLSRELATHLTGRYREFRLFPFSFAEFLRAKGFAIDETLALKERQGVLLGLLDEYLLKGGFPEVVVRHADAKGYLSTLFDSILLKGIVRRYGVRYASKLQDLGKYLLTNHAREYSCTGLKNTLDFRSVHTVENYIGYLGEAFLLFSIARFSWKAGERAKAPRKVYPYDPGVVNAVRFRIGADTGRLLESLVAIELLRRGEDLYYYKGAGGREVDFVVRREGAATELIQVCYDLADPKTRKRELQSLAKAADELRSEALSVFTWDDEGEETVAGRSVRFVPVWKWLLGV